MFIELWKKLEIELYNNREKIEILEYYLKNHVINIKTKNDYDYEHIINPGMYMRKIHIPAGDLVIGQVHKTRHMNYILSGTATVVSDDFLFTGTGLRFFDSNAETKKAVYAHTDVTYMTKHLTDKTDLDEIQKDTVYDSDLSWIKMSDKCLG